MFKKNVIFLSLCMITVLILFGCQEKSADEEIPTIIDVQVKLSPEAAKVNENVLFEVTVTQGDDKVTDAESVEFEFAKQDGSNKEKIAVKHKKDGIYSLEKSFAQEGDYYLIPHVDARGMHAMPKKEFTVVN